LLRFGSDGDAAVALVSSANSADAEVTNLIEGTSDHQGTAANSLVFSNVTDDGDIQMLVSDGGNSKEFLLANGDTADLVLGHGMATATVKTASGVLTLDSGAAINIEPASGSAILLDGTISIDAGLVTGATSVTIGSTIITDGVITDSSGLQLAANLDINGTADISGDLTMSAGDIDMNTNDLTNVGVSGDYWQAGEMKLTGTGQFDILIEPNNGGALDFTPIGGTAMMTIDTRPGSIGANFFTFSAPASPTGTSGRDDVNQHIIFLKDYTVTLADTETIDGAWEGVMLEMGVPTFAHSGSGTRTVTTASSLHIEAIVPGTDISISNNRMISTTESDCYLTHDGVWTDSSSTQKGKQDIIDLPLQDVGSLISQIRPRTYQYKDSRGDFGRTRYGAVAEEFPDFLRVPGDASTSAVNSTVLANFALVSSVYLADKYEQLNERLEAIGA
jgi:hypothetical protein